MTRHSCAPIDNRQPTGISSSHERARDRHPLTTNTSGREPQHHAPGPTPQQLVPLEDAVDLPYRHPMTDSTSRDDFQPQRPAGLMFPAGTPVPLLLAVLGFVACIAALVKAFAYSGSGVSAGWTLVAVLCAVVGGFGASQHRKQHAWAFEQKLAHYVDGDGTPPLL